MCVAPLYDCNQPLTQPLAQPRVPFVPFPVPPIEQPWAEGIESGVSLVGGNGVTTPTQRNIGDVPTGVIRSNLHA
jgi:hypothetical protein